MERVKQQIALLCQQKENILTTMKNALVELHQNQEPPEAEDSDLESLEENGSAAELQVSFVVFFLLYIPHHCLKAKGKCMINTVSCCRESERKTLRHKNSVFRRQLILDLKIIF